MLRRLLLAATCLIAAPAHAEWKQAVSPHFIVYSERGEASVREMAMRLEKLDLLQRTVSGVTKPASPIKVKVYVVGGFDSVKATMPYPMDGVAAYYSVSDRGPFSVMSTESNYDAGFYSQTVIFHELTHHFMFQYFNAAYPTWYVEGIADFIGTAKIDASNRVILGPPMLNRYLSMKNNMWMPVKQLLGARSYDDVKGELDQLYAEGWLLTHYLTLGGKRGGQLTKYLIAINSGKSFMDAATEAFGDLGKLNAELIAYYRQSFIPQRVLEFKPLPPAEIVVTDVSPAQGALMVQDAMLSSGLTPKGAPHFAEIVRSKAARYPDDPFALRIRAEADRAAGDKADWAAAVARWIAVAPTDPLAMMHQGLVEMDALKTAKSTDTQAWKQARSRIVAATRGAPNDPQIFKAYYESFKLEGIDPPAGAQNALYKALDLLPQNEETRYALAADFEQRGLIKDAIDIIRPAAFQLAENGGDDPEKAERDQKRNEIAGIPTHETPRAMLTRLEKKLGAGGPAPAEPKAS